VHGVRADLPKLQALGYDPAAIVQAAQDRADSEAAFSQIVPDDVRRHPTRLLDRVLARELNTPDMVRAWRELADAYGMRVFDALPERTRQRHARRQERPLRTCITDPLCPSDARDGAA
jgi:hypothetical protein